MQKKLIALAIAGLASSAAFAQTNVTIYGVVDAYYANMESDQTAVGVKDAKFSGLNGGALSGSRLGFRASEDLGNGWSANALMEFGTLGPDGGAQAGAGSVSGLGSTRQIYLDLTSKSMGSFRAGRIYTAGSNSAVKFDPEGASAFGPVSRITTGLALSIDGGGNSNARVNNSIAWLSPNWNGFTAQLQYAFGENGEQNATVATGNSGDDARMWGLGLDYSNGPLAVAFAYNDWNNYGGTISGVTGIERELTEWFVGASYDFGMLKLTGSYQDFDMDGMTTAAAQGAAAAAGTLGAKSEGDIWSLGVIVPVMKVGAITLSYASLDRTTRANGLAATPKLSADADGWGITYKHNLSKRTTAYVGYTTLDNGNKLNAVSVLGAGSGVAAPSAGGKSSGYGIGMRHTF